MESFMIFAAIAAYSVFSVIMLIVLFITVMIYKMVKGRRGAERELSLMSLNKITGLGSVDSLTVIPIVDYYGEDDGYSTEEGVAYIIKAGSSTILFDLGLNKKKEHPSPLLKNLDRAGIKISEIDKIVISHIHSDHVGGLAEQRNRQFSFSAGDIELSSIPVYAPGAISPSKNNPGPLTEIISEPVKIDTGIASIGIYPRSLFLIGYTAEQSLAVNVKGKGIVLIIGCGHQGIEQIIKRAESIFDEPVYGIIGGLHLPVNGGRFMVGPFNLQNIVGVDRNPLRGIRENDVLSVIEMIKKMNLEIIALSPHDSSDWTIDKFKEAFIDTYVEILAGKPITV
jgi:7,8-dihydropterin-6-yl-methyl-4-(beta-D-ribofuranosyl)aminobenzene 5'-phosphate synthase